LANPQQIVAFNRTLIEKNAVAGPLMRGNTRGCLRSIAGSPKEIIFWGIHSCVFGLRPIAGLQRDKRKLGGIMAQPLMPKATAVWLIDNTGLSFRQIAAFTELHELEIQAIADGDVSQGIVGRDPVANSQLTQEEITRCEQDPRALLKMAKSDLPRPRAQSKGARYTPVSKRQDRPNAIAWLLKHHPELSDAQVCKLIGTTKDTIGKIRDKSHWNSANLAPRNPVTMGLCTELDLEKQVVIARSKNPEKIVTNVEPDPLPEELQINPEPDFPGKKKSDKKEDLKTSDYMEAAENLFRS
jgi:hypothetical protein|tara:strand:- start:446 stop:1339 length:894 start_codon:yes stop_codon:yes gene_type:complete